MRVTTLAASIALAATAVVVPATSASAAPDTTCMRAGIATLQGAGLLDDVARSGLPVSLALTLGVTPRAGVDVDVNAVLPLKVVLADHRAGADSLFIYPWC